MFKRKEKEVYNISYGYVGECDITVNNVGDYNMKKEIIGSIIITAIVVWVYMTVLNSYANGYMEGWNSCVRLLNCTGSLT